MEYAPHKGLGLVISRPQASRKCYETETDRVQLRVAASFRVAPSRRRSLWGRSLRSRGREGIIVASRTPFRLLQNGMSGLAASPERQEFF
jgi:hypothetical protein